MFFRTLGNTLYPDDVTQVILARNKLAEMNNNSGEDEEEEDLEVGKGDAKDGQGVSFK